MRFIPQLTLRAPQLGARGRLASWGMAFGMCLALVAGPATAMAQESRADDKVEAKVADVDPNKGELQTERRTLANEKSGTEVIRADNFVETRKFESIKLLDQQIAKIKRLLEKTPKDSPSRPDLLFKLAELNFEKSKYYQNKAYATQDECYAFDDKGDKQRAAGCRKQMKAEIDESVRLRATTIELYSDLISNHGSFNNMDEVLYYLGSNLMELKRKQEALKVYKQLLAKYSDSQYIPNVLVAFGDSYFEDDDMAAALKLYDKVTDSYKKSSVYGYATYKKAWCHFNLDNKEKALDLFMDAFNFAKKRTDLPSSKPLMKQAVKDIVTTYAFVGAASKAIPFFRKITNDERDEWLDMGERLAIYYADKGKFSESMAMYRELISLNKESVKVLDYQYEIVRNQSSNNAYSDETLKQIVLLDRLVQAAEQGKFKDRDDKAMDYPGKKAKVEELSRTWAQRYHREAQQTRNNDLYFKAYHLYKEYLDAFPDAKTDTLYEMTFFFGELLYKEEEFEKAATTYEKALEVKPKGKYTEEIVHSAVLAYFKLVSRSEAKADLNEEANAIGSEAAGEGDGKDKKEAKKKEVPKPKDIPELHQRLVKACERYMDYAPKGEKIVDVKYTRARVFYDYDHLEKAADAFKEVAWSHPDHRLAVIAANLHLDSLNALNQLDKMETAVLEYLDKKPIKDEVFIEEVTALASAISFKKCTVHDDKEEWKKASECFVKFFRQYKDSEWGDKALYNAALDFERLSDIGKAIQVRVFLLRNYGNSELAPITLYNIAANYHALAIYSRAAHFYEKFVQYFPDHEKTEGALSNASVFRHGMAEYDRAIEDYNKYLDKYGRSKPKEAAEVHFQIGKIYEKQKKGKKAFDHYEEYLRKWASKGSDDNKLVAHLKLGMYYWDKKGRTNRKKALREFERTLAEYKKLSDSEKKEAVEGRDAAAQAMFMMGEDIFEDLTEMDIDSRNEKELQKRIQKKIEKAKEAQAMFEQVFKFERPDWTIAAYFRIGDGMENFANSIRSTKCPNRLSYDQCEIYKGLLEDNASTIEDSSVSFYEKALEASKVALWFNKFTKEAEVRLANLRPKDYRPPSEFRAEPGYIQSGFEGVEFLKDIKDKDRLDDIDAGDAEESTETASAS